MEPARKSISPAIIASSMKPSSELLQPLDCSSSPVLDLCTRRRDQPPSPPLSDDGASVKSTFHQQMHSPPPMPDSRHHDTAALKSPHLKNRIHRECDYLEDKATLMKNMTEIISTGLDSFGSKSRPFKSYPKDPFFLAIESNMTDPLMDQESVESYAEFRQKMLSRVRTNSNAVPGITNAKMRRSSLSSSPVSDGGKDASYWEKRRKNNEAAKRSRDARRAKEDEIAIRAAFLEQENLKLKYEVAALRTEASKLRCLLYG